MELLMVPVDEGDKWLSKEEERLPPIIYHHATCYISYRLHPSVTLPKKKIGAFSLNSQWLTIRLFDIRPSSTRNLRYKFSQ